MNTSTLYRNKRPLNNGIVQRAKYQNAPFALCPRCRAKCSAKHPPIGGFALLHSALKKEGKIVLFALR